VSRYTRMTVVGTGRRAEVVVPSDEGLAVLLPELLDLLGEAPAATPRAVALVRLTGEQLDLALDCAGQDVADGEVVRLVRVGEAPPPPSVVDVTDATADELAERPDRWDATARHATAAAGVGVAVAVAGLAALRSTDAGPLAAALAVVGLLALLVAAPLGRAGSRYANLVLTAVAAGAGLPLAVALSAEDRAGAWQAGLLLAWLAVGLGRGVGGRDRGAVAGAGVGVALTGLHLALDLTLDAPAADAVVVTVALVLLGLLPWYAMTSAGLTGLDDAAMEGRPPLRTRVRATLGDAYRALTWSAVATAVAIAVSAGGLLLDGDPAALALGLVAVLLTALRTRSLPLRTQVGALWFAVVAPLVALGLSGAGDAEPALVVGAALAFAIVAATLGGVRTSNQQRARLRRLGDTLEQLAVLAVLPLLLGVFGVYADLLGAF